jgi:hypothetical protein
MEVLVVPEKLKNRYQGAGLAIGAHANKSLINFRYLRNICPTLDVSVSDIDCLHDDYKFVAAKRAFDALHRQEGAVVSIGMLSAHEFVILR